MLRSDFHYDLPESLIAQAPTAERRGSRLLVVRPDAAPADKAFADLAEFLRPGDLLVVNDTRVIPARLFGRKSSGGRLELLVERIIGERRALCHLRVSKKPAVGAAIHLDGGACARLLDRHDGLFEFEFDTALAEYLQAHGHMPLPPYIRRDDQHLDRERYQTVYARAPGAVAAPTAGLHFDAELLRSLAQRGVSRASLTLHVGAGTFQPVRVDRVEEHRMHAEWIEVDAAVCAAIERTRAAGGRVVAVGTTVVRALESAAATGALAPYRGETRIFITPGFRFRVVDLLVTNFHLPESTLLMLVCAFGGYATVMGAYRHAVESAYRFFSYGDAMLLVPDGGAGCAAGAPHAI